MRSKLEVYLITGFLGAGKTTFIREFLASFPERKLGLIVNEFGKAGIDGKLLDHLQIPMWEIVNGSIFCVCQLPAFETALEEMLKLDREVLIVEASGLADPSSIRGLLKQSRFEGRLDYKGAVCLVDASRFEKYIDTAVVAKTQAAVANAFVINKTDLASTEEIERVNQALKIMRPDAVQIETSYCKAEDIAGLRAFFEGETIPQLIPEEDASQPGAQDLSLRKLGLRIPPEMPAQELEHFLKLFADRTWRIKGLLHLDQGNYLVDCVGPVVQMEVWPGEVNSENILNVLYNNQLPALKAIQDALKWVSSFDIRIVRD